MGTVSHLIVGANSIVAEDGTFTILVETAEQVEGVVRHEASSVESHRQELGNALCGWLTSVLHDIGADARDQVLVQSLNVCYHTSRGNDALGSQLGSLGVRTGQNAESVGDTSVGSDADEVLSRNG